MIPIQEAREFNKEVRVKTFSYISAALGLVAGLAWNDAVKFTIEKLFPVAKNTIAVKFLYAIAVTIVVVILVNYLDKIFNRREAETQKS